MFLLLLYSNLSGFLLFAKLLYNSISSDLLSCFSRYPAVFVCEDTPYQRASSIRDMKEQENDH